MTDPVGKARIEIEADTSKVKKGIADARTEVEGLGKDAQKAGHDASSAFDGAAKSIENSTSGVKKFAGAITSVIGVAGAAAAAITAIGTAIKAVADYMRDGQKVADEYLASLSRQDDPARSLDAVQRKIQELNAELEYEEQNPILGRILGRRRKQIEEELEAYRSANESISKRLAAARRQAEREEKAAAEAAAKEQADGVAKALLDQAEELRISLLPEDAQIEAKARAQMQKIQEARAATDDEALKEELRRYENMVFEKLRIDIKAFDQRTAEQERKEMEAAERMAKRYKDLLTRAFEEAASTLNETLAGSFGSFNNLSDAARDIANAIERRSR